MGNKAFCNPAAYAYYLNVDLSACFSVNSVNVIHMKGVNTLLSFRYLFINAEQILPSESGCDVKNRRIP